MAGLVSKSKLKKRKSPAKSIASTATSVSSKTSKSASLTPSRESQRSVREKHDELSALIGLVPTSSEPPVTHLAMASSPRNPTDCSDLAETEHSKVEPDQIILADAPTSVSWMSMANNQASNETAVEAFVSRELFPVLKFITNRDVALRFDIDKTKTICGFVLDGLNIPQELNREDWWQTMKNCVANSVNQLRNNKNTSVKWACFGKCCVILTFIVHRIICFANSKLIVHP